MTHGRDLHSIQTYKNSDVKNVVSGIFGLLHLLFSIIALVAGVFVLLAKKGTKQHKRIGYLYVSSMIVLNLTALSIYELTNTFGIFHWASVACLLTILAGIYPIRAKKGAHYVSLHFSFMFWSIIGLYCAFVAELFSRIPHMILTQDGRPMIVFYGYVAIATGLVIISV